MNLDELKKDINLINLIDWDLTHEDAIGLYLEWGGNWKPGGVPYVVRNKSDSSHYFVVNTWEKPAKVYLIKRTIEDAKELVEIPLLGEKMKKFLDETGHSKGVYTPGEKLKNWLKSELLN
ncbi:MAG: hypothetical protein RBR53_11465 [Desulforegulaceae bacterium]|nr:hypothetical protein [Desulforegulaceae bacterium]